MAIAIDEEAHFLGLMSGDDDVGADGVGEGGGAGGGDAAAPDELVDGAGATDVIRAGEGAVENGEVEFFDLGIGRQTVAEEEAIFAADGQG